MHYASIRRHLRPYNILRERQTTINHAFASALAPHDDYEESIVRLGIDLLGQDPDQPLHCAYCGEAAQTWDHISAIVKAGQFSGHGHRMGNLLPCCKPCNSQKGNTNWADYLAGLGRTDYAERHGAIQHYLSRFSVIDERSDASPMHVEFESIRQEIFRLMRKADEIASTIRSESPHR